MMGFCVCSRKMILPKPTVNASIPTQPDPQLHVDDTIAETKSRMCRIRIRIRIRALMWRIPDGEHWKFSVPAAVSSSVEVVVEAVSVLILDPALEFPFPRHPAPPPSSTSQTANLSLPHITADEIFSRTTSQPTLRTKYSFPEYRESWETLRFRHPSPARISGAHSVLLHL